MINIPAIKYKEKDGVWQVVKGVPGKDGKSPYEIAKEGGYVGSEEEYNALFLQLPNKVNKSTLLDLVLQSSDWVGNESPFSLTLKISQVTGTTIQEFINKENVGEEVLLTIQKANIQDGGQSGDGLTTGEVVLLAYGEKPLIDLPIRVIIRRDL